MEHTAEPSIELVSNDADIADTNNNEEESAPSLDGLIQ